jgi:hypothetical protein
MRVAVLLFASLVILADAPSSADAQEPTDASPPAPKTKTCGESFSRDSTAEFNKKCVALAGPLAAMRGETLVLRMDDGSRKTFANKNGFSDAFGYGLGDFYPSTHIFVVCDYGVDASHCSSVDGRTGRQLDFGYLYPEISPDGTWVLTIEYGEDDEADSNFAIVDVRGAKQRTVWTSKASKTRLPAKAKFVTWTDNKTIELTSPDQTSVFLVQAAGGSWSVSKAAK